jgi:hypothetical protein
MATTLPVSYHFPRREGLLRDDGTIRCYAEIYNSNSKAGRLSGKEMREGH